MKDYALIRESYTQVEKCYVKIIDDAIFENNNTQSSKYIKLSRINEYAYFVLFWGQFEAIINDNALEIEGENYFELGFMLRVKLSLSPNHKYYSEIDKYYYWRCELAHGRIATFPELTLATIFDKIEEITEDISNNPLPLGDDDFDFFIK